jgi:hypothetical protein
MYQRAANQKIGAGALANNFGIGEAKTPYSDDSSADQRTINAALVNWSVTVGRVFIVRVTLAFLYATGVLAFLGFLSTLGSDSAAGDSDADRKRRYLCALSVIVNMVAVAHYKIITKIRGYEYGAGSTANVFATNNVSAFSSHNSKLAVGVEMAVDGIRHSDWLVTLVFLIYKIYFIAGYEADGVTPKTGDIFESPGTAAACAVLMVVLSAIVRIGTDEVWDYRKNIVQSIISACLWGVSLLIMILIIIDIDTAVEQTKGVVNVELYKSFYLIWIGYPIVSLFGWGVRLVYSCMDEGYAGNTPEWLSLVKDLCYCFLDSWAKGAFALWTAYTAFHVHLLNAPAASQLN